MNSILVRHLSWNNVFNSKHHLYGWIENAFKKARECEYPYIMWNGVLHNTHTGNQVYHPGSNWEFKLSYKEISQSLTKAYLEADERILIGEIDCSTRYPAATLFDEFHSTKDCCLTPEDAKEWLTENAHEFINKWIEKLNEEKQVYIYGSLELSLL